MKKSWPRETRFGTAARVHTRTGVAGRVGLLAAVVAGLVAGSVAAPAAAADSAVLDYVALGDSYTSGIGAPNVSVSPLYPAALQPCYQASPGYVDVLAARDDVHLAANAACSGWTATMVPFQVDVASAAGLLNADTDVVTITAGGNDVEFLEVLEACLLPSTVKDCKARVKVAEAVAKTQLLPALTIAYAAIRAKAPNATIVALGYPHLFSPEFGDNTYITDEAAEAFNRGTDTLNKVIRKAAKRTGTVYVDVTDEFACHGFGSPDSWFVFNPANPLDGLSFHPTKTGYAQGYYPAVINDAGIRALRN